MPAKKETIILELTSDAKGAVTGVKSLNKEMNRLEKNSKKGAKTAKGLGSVWRSLRANWLAATAAIGGLVVTMTKAVRAAAAQELAEKKLTAALKNVKGASDTGAASLIKLAKALQTTTAFGDEQIINAQAMLATFQLTEQQIAAVTPRMLDMAAASSQAGGAQADLQAIAIALGKGITGQVGSLARYGVVLSEETKKTKDFNLVLQDLDANFKGIAEQSAVTMAGQMKTVANIIGDNLEVVGKYIFQGIAPLINGIKDLLTTQADLISQSVKLGVSQLETADSTQKLLNRYFELADKTEKSVEENREFVAISKTLKTIVPEAAVGVDKLTGAYVINKDAAEKAVTANRNYARATLEIEAAAIAKRFDEITLALDKNGKRQIEVTRRVREFQRISTELKEGLITSAQAFREMNAVTRTQTGEFAGAAFEGRSLERQLKTIGDETAGLQGKAKKLTETEANLTAEERQLVETYDRLIKAGVDVADSTDLRVQKLQEEWAEVNRLNKLYGEAAGNKRNIDEEEKAKQEEKLLSLSEFYQFIGDEEQAALQRSLEQQQALLEATNITEEQRTAIIQAGTAEREAIIEAFATKEEELNDASIEMYEKRFSDLSKAERESVLFRISEEKKFVVEAKRLAGDFGATFGTAIGGAMGSFVAGTKEADKSFHEMVESMMKAMVKKAFVEGLTLLANVLFPGAGAIGGGLARGFFGALGFEEGGYTGSGGKSEVAGAVHKGEYVMKADTVTPESRKLFDMLNYGAFLPAKRSGFGYQAGGLVREPTLAGRPLAVTVQVSGLDKAQWDELTRDEIVPAVERTLNDLNRSLFTGEGI